MTTAKPTDILPKLPTGMDTEMSTKNALKPKKDSLQMKQKPELKHVSNNRDIDYNTKSQNVY
jgi:hypothetical protein